MKKKSEVLKVNITNIKNRVEQSGIDCFSSTGLCPHHYHGALTQPVPESTALLGMWSQ